MPPAVIQKVDLTKTPQNKKIVFNDDGEIVASNGKQQQSKQKSKKKHKLPNGQQKDGTERGKSFKKVEKNVKDENQDVAEEKEEEGYFAKRENERLKKKSGNKDVSQKKWYYAYAEYTTNEDVLDMKEKEQMELYNLCKSSFEAERPAYNKRNPSDARWLQTALHRGTAKDRANAGALLVTSNPLGNLEALSTLITFTKPSNKSSTDVIGVLNDLWKEVLLPPHRKLLSLQLRGADWRHLRKNTALTKEQQRQIFAYWYFENELKDQYFEFLKNLQMGMQSGQENNKSTSIVIASQLLAYAPEKEQMLLTMVVNKLGDPIAKIASKALHHLTEVAHKHPNMGSVIVTEAEKLLFRNNISERAQHFALCFLANIASETHADVCSKLVHICFAFFKVLVQKGAVNNRTMQAILRCLQKAIVEAKPADAESGEILTKDMQDTIYRLVHLADVRVSVQTLGLLLQLITVKTEKTDRFYNALYKKLLDLEMTNIGMKTAAQFLHIVHRAIHIDANLPRAQAFIKRLLQLALYMPPHVAAGCLIVVQKLLRSRRELLPHKANQTTAVEATPKVSADDDELAKFDSDGEEKYEDVLEDAEDENIEEKDDSIEIENQTVVGSSWHHAKVASQQEEAQTKVKELSATKYDPYHRVPMYAGAELALRNELLLLREHFHPTVQVFADSILNDKRINYYGDPLRDFGLPHFLERFAFKNPKKIDREKAEPNVLAHKRYTAFGARGLPVKSLTKTNCTEDEMYIFNFLEQKRAVSVKKTKGEQEEEDGDDDLRPGEVNDDEFEDYLDGFFGKKAKAAAAAEKKKGVANSDDEEEIDFLAELGGELQKESKKQNKKKKTAVTGDEDDDGDDDFDDDWGDENEADFSAGSAGESDDEDGSIDLNENDDEDDDGDDMSISEQELEDDEEEKDDDDDDESVDESTTKSKAKKSTKKRQATMLDGKSFAKKLKHSDDMSSLFAAADDFADLLEETGKTKGQGTANAIFNRDKSSDKQMKWEQKRHSNAKTYGKKQGNAKKFSAKKRK